jgi:hypothetical protein
MQTHENARNDKAMTYLHAILQKLIDQRQSLVLTVAHGIDDIQLQSLHTGESLKKTDIYS